MRTFLGFLMVLIVSGDNEVTIEGVLGENVLLPCTCSDRNLDEEFKWQMDEPNKTLVFACNRTTSEFSIGYQDRAKVFVAENSSNCSLLLTKVKADDQGKYKCSFSVDEQYTRFFINLSVRASYDVCQKSVHDLSGNSSRRVFWCDVRGPYQKAEIQWHLDGKLLTNSSTVNITHTYSEDAPSGISHFKSTLITQLSWISEPKCGIKAKGIPSNISNDCTNTGKQSKDDGKERSQSIYFIFIPIVLVLGCSLVLWRRWKISQNLPRIRENTQGELQCESFPLNGG